MHFIFSISFTLTFVLHYSTHLSLMKMKLGMQLRVAMPRSATARLTRK